MLYTKCTIAVYNTITHTYFERPFWVVGGGGEGRLFRASTECKEAPISGGQTRQSVFLMRLASRDSCTARMMAGWRRLFDDGEITDNDDDDDDGYILREAFEFRV